MSENIENVYIDTVPIGAPMELSMKNIEKIFSTYHEKECCEWHWADWDSIHGAVETAAEIVPEFDTVEIKGTPGMGFTLFFINGEKRWGVFVPCYGDNNGYYSTDLTLVVQLPNGFKKEYDIESYQKTD